jgi:hypothetical protein
MSLGFTTIKDILDTVILFLGAVGIFVGLVSYFTSEKQFRFGVIISLTERFQRIFVHFKSNNSKEKKLAIQQYVDLCNEELFYFKQGYVPDEVAYEWIDGMINLLPCFDLNGKNLNQDCLPGAVDLVRDYPRLKKIFTFEKIPGERKDLIKEIKRKTKDYSFM